jgi:hypothetical protein
MLVTVLVAAAVPVVAVMDSPVFCAMGALGLWMDAEAPVATMDAALRWLRSGRCLLGSGGCRLAPNAIPEQVWKRSPAEASCRCRLAPREPAHRRANTKVKKQALRSHLIITEPLYLGPCTPTSHYG